MPQKTAIPARIAPTDDISAPARGRPQPAASAVKSPTTTTSTAGDKLLWDSWYTVTVGKSQRYEYYNDRAELKKGRVVFQNHAWKREESYINEEQLGVFAPADEQLTPLFFNFHSTYRATETTIDGNVTSGQLIVRIRKGQQEPPLIKKSIPPKTFFSAMFPIWLGHRLATFKKGQTYSFQTILEDNVEAAFGTINGQVRLEAPDALATQAGASKITVNLNNAQSVWWVDPNGAPLRIELPLQKTVVERVSAEVAKKFLVTPDLH